MLKLSSNYTQLKTKCDINIPWELSSAGGLQTFPITILFIVGVVYV